MAISTQVFSAAEFKFYVNPETAVGDANTTTMKQLNVNDMASMTQGIVLNLDRRSGSSGAFLNAADKFARTTMQESTITMNIVFDEVTLTELHEAALGLADVSDVITVPASYSFTPLANGEDITGDNHGTWTVAITSPITDKTILMTGCTLTNLTATMDAGTNGGRMEGSVTFTTKYPILYDQTDPASATAYGTDFKFLCDIDTKTIASNDVVLSKIEWVIENPAVYAGCVSGEPEVVARAVAEPVITCNVATKYDANTQALRSSYKDGTAVAVTLTNAALGITLPSAFLTTDPSDGDGDMGVFRELSFKAAYSGAGNVAIFDLD